MLAGLPFPSFTLPKWEIGIRKEVCFFFFFLILFFWEIVLWFLGFSMVLFIFFFRTLALTLPLLPACSLTSGSCCSDSVCRRRWIKGPPEAGASLSLCTRGTWQEPQLFALFSKPWFSGRSEPSRATAH